MNKFEQYPNPSIENESDLNKKQTGDTVETQPQKVSSYEDTQYQETNGIDRLKPETAIAQEKGIFERFRGKARGTAEAMMLMTALSFIPEFTQETYAQEKGQQPYKQEQVKQEGEIDESKLTESSTWARDVMENAHADLKKIKTAEDAKWFILSYSEQLVHEYFFPTKGNLKSGVFIKTREYSEDDMRLLLKTAKEMRQILQDLNTKYDVETDTPQNKIDVMINKLERESSYSFQKQQEILDRFEKRTRQMP